MTEHLRIRSPSVMEAVAAGRFRSLSNVKLQEASQPKQETAAAAALSRSFVESIMETTGTPLSSLEGSSCSSRSNDGQQQDGDNEVRHGTVSSARFNLLSTMVGGGVLSLPLAFQKAGNGLVAPLLLLCLAWVTEFCLTRLVQAAGRMDETTSRRGRHSLEGLVGTAFGSWARRATRILVVSMCFCVVIAYAVLLRDMLEPLTHGGTPWHHNKNSTNAALDNATTAEAAIYNNSTAGDSGLADDTRTSWHNNLPMVIVALLTTPLCLLPTLTSLQRFGAASMLSVLVVGACVVYRCISDELSEHASSSWREELFQPTPTSWMDLLEALPLFISCYVCHYNVLPVYNDLQQDPDVPGRVDWWLQSTVGSATVFYLVVGLAGSAYGAAKQHVLHGNILLDFDESDPLLLVGRLCLAFTIAMAFPMLVIPARDVLVEQEIISVDDVEEASSGTADKGGTLQRASLLMGTPSTVGLLDDEDSDEDDDHDELIMSRRHRDPFLCEPLLEMEEASCGAEQADEPWPQLLRRATTVELLLQAATAQLRRRRSQEQGEGGTNTIVVTLGFYWSAIAVACCVESIDVVWGLVGSSISMMLSFVIPCGCYLAVLHQNKEEQHVEQADDYFVHVGDDPLRPAHVETSKGDAAPPLISRCIAWSILTVSVPLMVALTANAVYQTFFTRQ